MPTGNQSPTSVEPSMASTALALARYVKELDASTIGAATRDTALRCVLDVLGCAAAALDKSGPKAAKRAAPALHGAGDTPIWFTGRSAARPAALLANSAASAALDLDDGSRKARGHAGAAVVPAALACIDPLSRTS